MKIFYLLTLLFGSSILTAQTFDTPNNYVLIIQEDSIALNQYMEAGIAITTNASSIANIIAYQVDTNTVFDSLSLYKSSLPLLPDSLGTWLNRNEIYVFEDKVCRVIQSHWRMHFDPHDTPALFLFRELGCADWVQPTGGHDAYNIGDCITFNAQEYESRINANVWSPTAYPAGWQLK